MIHDYGTDGILNGGWVTTNPGRLREIDGIVTALGAKAMPLNAYVAQADGEEDHTEAPRGG